MIQTMKILTQKLMIAGSTLGMFQVHTSVFIY